MQLDIQRVHVIGMGEVGRRIAGAVAACGIEVRPVTRDSGWDAAIGDTAAGALRVVCVREGALAGVLERLRDVPAERIALVQNGWIRPLVDDRPGITRGLIWFTAKGDFFRVLRASPFSGSAAPGLAAVLDRGGLAATAVSAAEFDREDAEKMGFNCVVGLPLAVHGVSLGEYLTEHRDEARQVFEEAVTACARSACVEPDAEAWRRFVDLVVPLHWVRASSAKALDLRNGAVVRLAEETGTPAPTNRRLVDAAGGAS